MYTKTRLTLTVLTLATVLLAGCAAPTSMTEMVEVGVEVTRVVEKEGETVVEKNGHTLAVPAHGSNRLIIKNADLRLLVADTDVAIDRTTQIAADCGGYIISTRTWYEQWYEQNYKYATILLAVPSDQFEWTMRRLRNLALLVQDEATSGQDVTDEYVDLQSRLTNLEATRDRIRAFLDEAKDVKDALDVNRELAAVEDQIEQVQGRMNYLFDRAAYSTVTIQIDPELPATAPTPTPRLPWQPAQTVRQAGNSLGSILRALGEAAIWFIVVGAPLLAPPVLIIWAVQRRIKRKTSE